MNVSFSVVIPLYNKANHIVAALESVMAQTHTDWECVVVDDGSTDGGAELVENLGDLRIRCIRQANAGAGAARNRGAKEARYPYLAFLDGDDLWKPNHLAILAQLIERFPEAVLYFTYYHFLKPHRELPARWAFLPDEHQGLVPNYFRSVLHGDQLAMTSGACVPRSSFEAVGGYPENERTYQDQSLWAKLALHGPLAFSREQTAWYKLDTEHMLTAPRAIEAAVPFIGNLEKALKENRIPAEWEEDVRGLIASNLLGHAGSNVLAGRSDLAKRFLRDPRTALFPKRRMFWRLMAALPRGLARAIFSWNQNRKGVR